MPKSITSLVIIFEKYVIWFTWKNLSMLRSCIQSSSAVTTVTGKTLEYLFALEWCESARGKLWKFLRDQSGLIPLPHWNPSICTISAIDKCIDTNLVSVMLDPDRSNSKSDVIFFATELSTCPITKMISTFDGMSSLSPAIVGEQTLQDYRLFVAPKCTKIKSDDPFLQNYAENRSQAFLSFSAVQKAFHFDIDLICNPGATDNAINQLVAKAENIDDSELAIQIASEVAHLSNSNNRVNGHEGVFQRVL